MNLQNYLKHADGCALNNFEPEFYTVPDCTCSLASIQSRLVLLPDGFKEKIVEVMEKHSARFNQNDGWGRFSAVHFSKFNTVAEDIVKAVNK